VEWRSPFRRRAGSGALAVGVAPPASPSALALVPVAVGVFLFAIMIPRATVPEAVPLPRVDFRAFDRVVAEDRRLAEEARRKPLSDEVREMGSVIREHNTREVHDEDATSMREAHEAIERVLPRVVEPPDDLLRLRAAQLESFLVEVERYEATGIVSDELIALGGNFVHRMEQVGWCKDHKVVLTVPERRAAFKLAWNGIAGVSARARFALTLDETRAIYTLYLAHPHAPESAKQAIDSARRVAKDKKSCDALDAGERLAIEGWRLDKLQRLGALDPEYPLAYARGVSQFRMGKFDTSAQSFEAWLKDHPSGPWTIRARNHLKAALEASTSQF
jgi:TolA-binding protein